MHGAVLLLRLGGQAESRLRSPELARQQLHRVTADLRSMLEAVAGAAANDPDVLSFRMPVENEILTERLARAEAMAKSVAT